MKHQRPAAPIYIGEVRELIRDDLSRLTEGNRTDQAFPKRLRESHHMIARLSAAGLSRREISAKTGYSETRITQLLDAPATIELVSHYRDKIDDRFMNNVDAYFELATSNMVAAERHIADAIAEADERDELIPIRTALAISRDAADRFGYNKKQTNVNINVDFAAQLERAIKRSGKQINSVVNHASPAALSNPPQETHLIEDSPLPLFHRLV